MLSVVTNDRDLYYLMAAMFESKIRRKEVVPHVIWSLSHIGETTCFKENIKELVSRGNKKMPSLNKNDVYI